VFKAFYKLIELETSKFIESSINSPGPLVTKVDGVSSILGKPLKNYLDDMQLKFDLIISNGVGCENPLMNMPSK
jgi:hypothetical protein